MPCNNSFATHARLEVIELEDRCVPANVLSPSSLIYQDKDGDSVLVSFTKPVLSAGNPNSIFVFDSGAGAVNGNTSTPEQLQRIDLTTVLAAAVGTGITITSTRNPTSKSGDGFAAIGEIDASGIDLGAVKIDGDLGRIIAGDSALNTPGLKTFTSQSIGRYGTSTGATNLHSQIQGKLGKLAVKGDVDGAWIDVTGNADGSIDNLAIGGSVIGGDSQHSGEVSTSGDIKKGVIGGDIVAGTSSISGLVGAGTGGLQFGTVGSLSVGGNVMGGIQTGSTDLTFAGAVIANHIKGLTIGGSLVAGTKTGTGKIAVSGSIVSFFEISKLSINGSVVGNATNPAVISAVGQQFPSLGKDVAIGAVIVKGRVEYGLIEAGISPLNAGAYQPDADAQIGSVTVGGDWVASSIAAGAVAGAGGFGTPQDTKLSGTGVRDDPATSSTIGKVSIGGQVSGTTKGSDNYGIVAEMITRVKVGESVLPLVGGRGNDDLKLGITGDFRVRELKP